MRLKCKLRILMAIKEVDQKTVAAETGLSPTTISKLARNQIDRFDGKTVTLLCQYFNLKSLAELIEIDPNLPDYGED